MSMYQTGGTGGNAGPSALAPPPPPPKPMVFSGNEYGMPNATSAYSPNPTIDEIQRQQSMANRSQAQSEQALNYGLPSSGAQANQNMGIIGAHPGNAGLGGDAGAQSAGIQNALNQRYAQYYGSQAQNQINNLRLGSPELAAQMGIGYQNAAAENQARVYGIQTAGYNGMNALNIQQDAARNAVIGSLFGGAGQMGAALAAPTAAKTPGNPGGGGPGGYGGSGQSARQAQLLGMDQ